MPVSSPAEVSSCGMWGFYHNDASDFDKAFLHHYNSQAAELSENLMSVYELEEINFKLCYSQF